MKTVNCKILKIVSILLFSCFFAGLAIVNVSAANGDSITVYNNIYNASTTINAEFEYKITPDGSNPSGATNEPTSLTIKFDNIMPSNNQTTKTGVIDFSNTTYTQPGTYKYILEEISSSNSEYQVSNEKYEIYVISTNTQTSVYQQAKNLNNNTKGNINFDHAPAYSFVTINLKAAGDAVDKQEYFRFIIYIDSLCTGCKYDMLGQDEYVNFQGQNIKTEDYYVVRGSTASIIPVGYIPNYIYLKDSQTMTIGLSTNNIPQIPIGTKVAIMVDGSLDNRKWTMYINGVKTQYFEYTIGQNINFNILLKRNMLVPNTGLSYEILPFVLLILIGIGSTIIFVKLRTKNAKKSN